jgi:molybdopterin-guanine dinucleotide biosynthesis protein A
MPGPVGALLLTGGASRRMGTPKAALPAGADGSFAERTAAILQALADPVLEVGPGWSGLRAVADDGLGPLAAVAAGWRALVPRPGAALVVACDLPRLDDRPLRALLEASGATSPQGIAIVPMVGGRLQPLCACYPATALDLAAELAGRGARALQDLLEAIDFRALPADAWADALTDVDTPADLARLGLPHPAAREP